MILAAAAAAAVVMFSVVILDRVVVVGVEVRVLEVRSAAAVVVAIEVE